MKEGKPEQVEQTMRLIDEKLYNNLINKLAGLPWRDVNSLIGALHSAPKVTKKK